MQKSGMKKKQEKRKVRRLNEERKQGHKDVVIPKASTHHVLYESQKPLEPPVKVVESWGPIFKLKLPKNSPFLARRQEERLPWKNVDMLDLVTVPSHQHHHGEDIVRGKQELQLIQSTAVPRKPPHQEPAVLEPQSVDLLTPSERIGLFYSNMSAGIWSARTLTEAMESAVVVVGGKNQQQERIESSRPGRTLKVNHVRPASAVFSSSKHRKDVRQPVRPKSSHPLRSRDHPIEQEDTEKIQQHSLTKEMSAGFWGNLDVARMEQLLNLDESKMPLLLFDDDTNDALDQDFICDILQDKKILDAFSPTYSLGEDWNWAPCKVLAYDPEMKRFQIQFKDNDRTKQVKRLALRFATEDEFAFKRRVQRCMARRDMMKSLLRFNKVLELWSDNLEDVSPIAKKWMENILKRTVSMDSMDGAQTYLNQNLKLLRTLLKEVKEEYTLAIRKSVVQYFAQEPWLCLQFAENRIPNLPLRMEEYRHQGMINTVRDLYIQDSSRSRRKVAAKHWTRDALVAKTNAWVHEMWLESFEHCLFVDITMSPPVNKAFPQLFPCLRGGKIVSLLRSRYFQIAQVQQLPCSLEEFEAVQKEHGESLTKFLVTTWRRIIVDHIQDHLHFMFNFYERDRDTFDQSLLRPLLARVTLLMQEQMRSVITRSIDAWVMLLDQFHLQDKEPLKGEETLIQLFKRRTTRRLVKETSEKDKWLDVFADDTSQAERTYNTLWDSVEDRVQQITPLFHVELRVEQGRVVFSPNEDQLKQVFLDALSRMESCVGQVRTLYADLLPLLFTEKTLLLSIDREEQLREEFHNARTRISNIFATCMEAPKTLLELYDEFSPLLGIDPEEYVGELTEKALEMKESILAQHEEDAVKKKRKVSQEIIAEEAHEEYVHQLTELQNSEVMRFQRAAKEIQNKSHNIEKLGLVQIDCTKVKATIGAKANEIAGAIMDAIVVDARVESVEISSMYKNMLEQMKQVPQNEAELIRLREYIVKSEDVIRKVDGQCQDIQSRLAILETFAHPMPEPGDFMVIWGAWLWPRRVREAARSALTFLGGLKMEMMDKLKKEQASFEKDLKRYADQVKTFEKYHDLADTEQYAEEANTLKDRLDEATRKANDFMEREEMFGWFPTEYPSLELIKKTFDPYFRLWSIVSDFGYKKRNWISGPFLDLEAEVIETLVSNWFKDTGKLKLHFENDQPDPHSVACQIHDEIHLFKEKMPLIQSLASPALRKRHWLQFSELLQEKQCLEPGEMLEPDEDLALQHLLDLNVERFTEEISSIREVAEKEYSLEKALDAMILEWDDQNIRYTITPYKDSGTFVVRDTDDIVTMLDDQLAKVQSMRGSQYIQPIESRALDWERKLEYTQTLLEEWLALQRTWLHLFPIFLSEDIKQQLPRESRLFHFVDLLWKKSMEMINGNPAVMEVSDVGFNTTGANTNDDQQQQQQRGLLYSFREANEKLEMVQRGLNVYLESKRLTFPRFFFLSDDELLEILSQTRDPQAIQPHLHKSFEGIHRIRFNGDQQHIDGMISQEGEFVAFNQSVWPNDPRLQGCVELWMLEVEAQMRYAVEFQIKQAMIAYDDPNSNREQWVLNWPGQAVLCANEIHWTANVERCLREGQQAMNVLYQNLGDQLQKLIQLVRGDLSKLNRKTLSALVVIDVHARDVVQELVESRIAEQGISAFQWQSQLRYYFGVAKEDLSVNNNSTSKSQSARRRSNANKFLPETCVEIRITNASQIYGFEYLGNSGRLVITPLTDRCYRTLVGAIALNYGGAPAGPAGTGKTETTKDLAKALATQCVVKNGSDGLNYLAMAKFFKGLAASGAWACFDEFNRIDVEVLSVVAQQVASIQAAKREGLTSFMFEGTPNLMLRSTCNVFITMNPGYAGRSELPDNLAALFRPCAMMVPDYSMIAEIVLYSYGFSDARNMARKITQVLRLCSEQLSIQHHYDYGMRSVKTILEAAGRLKQEKKESARESELTLCAITSVNLPKFVGDDLPLFQGIVRDLFPDVELPPLANVFDGKLQQVCKSMRLSCKKEFVSKCYQVYDTLQVRHGLMLVGETMSGKTSILNVLKETMGNVKSITINPKAVTQHELYGCFDPSTHEWQDGVLAIAVREFSREEDEDKKWIVFDGPVDAVWIEDMNTVLDDNKKLCLNSGEVIRLTDSMSMIYEVEDLAVASPATVSRCGMIYLEQSYLGWQILVECMPLPECLEFKRGFITKTLFSNLVPHALDALGLVDCISTIIPMKDMQHVNNLVNLFSAFLASKKFPEEMENSRSLDRYLAGLFLYALVWSVGGCLSDRSSRANFDEYLRNILEEPTEDEVELSKTQELAKLLSIPPEEKLFDLFPQDGRNELDFNWTKWVDHVPPFKPDEGDHLIVPTVDLVRTMKVFSDLVIHGQRNVLLCGPTGTGKSANIKAFLRNGLDEDAYESMFVQFSAQTKAEATQNMIESHLERRRKGVYGPAVGKRCVVFVDDLNVVQKETYGAQPVIELLRQHKDYEGWYDLKDKSFLKIQDVQYVAAMGPPGGGRNSVTPRYLRHYNILGMFLMDSDTLTNVFTKIMAHFRPSDPVVIVENIVGATIDVYNTVAHELLPTPTKSHYLYNLRDLSKVFQGIARAERSSSTNDLMRLWAHECLRVFQDRLVCEEDKRWFERVLETKMEQYLGVSWDKIFARYLLKEPQAMVGERLMFGQYFHGGDVYQEAPALEQVKTRLQTELDLYNEENKSGLDLVLFTSAIQHVARIARCIGQPLGHALLVGVGGSGRKSLTTLAAHIVGIKLSNIEPTSTYNAADWWDDMRAILKVAAVEPVVLVMSDAQLVVDTMLEDISNLLNLGEIPGIYSNAEDLKDATSVVPGGQYETFVARCKDNLRIALCFSPANKQFRLRLRNFPSLVNCCYINWFSAWSTDALNAVARKFLDNYLEESMLRGVINVCVDMQKRVSNLTSKFLAEERRYYYVTPTSFLELLCLFKKLLAGNRQSWERERHRFASGLEKLLQAEVSVAEMQKELTELQPVLEEATRETEALIVNIAEQKKDADVRKAIVEKEEEICNKSAMDALEIKEDCEKQLAEALPALESAMKALKTLNKSDITELKSMKKPPEGVKLTMEAVCIMLGYAPKKIKNPNTGKGTVDDYWSVAQKDLLGDSKFLQRLVEFDKDHIDQAVIEKIQPYTKLESFTAEIVKKASKAAAGLCKWIHALVRYDHVVKIVGPRREALMNANMDLEWAREALNEKKRSLQEVVDFLNKLMQEYDECNRKKQLLNQKVEDCTIKLQRATKLISGLANEKVRWAARNEELKEHFKNIVGDMLLSSGVIAYLGPFTHCYREECISNWISLLKEQNIPSCGNEFSLIQTLGNPVQIRQWVTLENLPNDSFSINNAIMLCNSGRWPLLIDPQGQANRWVRQNKKLVILKQTQSDFVRQLENALSFGLPVLLENVGESFDPILVPILNRKFFLSPNKTLMIRLGDKSLDYDSNFKLFMTTKLPNPHYEPEICSCVNLLNFVATFEGLQDQMLGITVAKEQPQLEEMKGKLIMESAANEEQLKHLESKILELLSSSEGDILDNENLIETLSASKITSLQIEQRVQTSHRMQQKNAKSRKAYQVVAIRASQLYFCVSDLSHLNFMYQFSLDWFIRLFLKCLDQLKHQNHHHQQQQRKDGEDDLRREMINASFTKLLYESVCSSLFAEHKLTFSLLLCTRLMADLDMKKLHFLIRGGEGKNTKKTQRPMWLTDKMWGELVSGQFAEDLDFLDDVYRSEDPQEMAMERYSLFDTVILLRILRPDKVVGAIRALVKEEMGQLFVEPPAFNLQETFGISSCTVPLVFILSPGSDPMEDLRKLAEREGFAKKLHSISMGQGQGPRAEQLIGEAIDDGSWVVLQNCHLAVSWLPTLERICDKLDPDRTSPDFRLILTSKPTSAFPVSLLQNGIKIIIEPPRGIKANLVKTWNNNFEAWAMESETKHPELLKKWLYSLCLFHASVQERNKFGPLGFNKPYDFNDSDLMISASQLKLFLDQAETEKDIPYEMFVYLTAECNYGGRITEEFDRRLVNVVFQDFFQTKQTTVTNDDPAFFGLHDNANISTATRETQNILSHMMLLTRMGGGGGEQSTLSEEDLMLLTKCKDIAKGIPALFDIDTAREKYPISYKESMHSVLLQELAKYNSLLQIIRQSLIDLQKALKGLALMSADLEQIGQSLMENKVPVYWGTHAYPSTKQLFSWLIDLQARVQFFRNWVDQGPPAEFWFGGFFFCQSFLTGIRQNYARHMRIPIDQIDFEHKFKKQDGGVVITGMFMEGARWDPEQSMIEESEPNVLYSKMAPISLLPKPVSEIHKSSAIYPCPVYRTVTRTGQINTIGISTNFCMIVNLPVGKTKTENHWIKRGVALLCECFE